MANGRATIAESAARQLANATKTRAQWGGITPRWLIPFLPWTPVEAGSPPEPRQADARRHRSLVR